MSEKDWNREEAKRLEIMKNYECDGQMTIYDFPEWLPESCKPKGERSADNGEKGKK